MKKITSRDNQQLKSARRVRDGKEADLMFVEGVKLFDEALWSGLEPIQVFVSESANNEADVTSRLRTRLEAFVVTDAVFKGIAETSTPEGLIGIFRRPSEASKRIDALLADPSRVPMAIYLYEINNPANLGAVIRTAEAAGVAGVITSPRSADAFSPKALRGSMGSAFRLPVWQGCDLKALTKWSDQRELRRTGTSASDGRPYTNADWREKRLLIFGSESHGITESVESVLHDRVSIPMASPVESLNLAVSCGVIAFEALRQIKTR